jgi:hypothetical protein
MKKIIFIFFGFSLLFSEKFLLKIDIPSQKEIDKIIELKIPVIENLNKILIANLDETKIEILNKNNFSYKILDKNPENKIYYIVFPSPFTEIKEIEKFGDVILKEEDFLIIRLKGKPDENFFSGKWELKRINFKEIKLKHSREFKREKIFRGNPIIEEIISRINKDSISSYIIRLQNFKTRYASTDSARAAANWIRNKFLSFGYDSVYLHYFSATYAPNVICTKVGEVNPSEIYIICGHFDCTSETPQTNAPGADDNASGTAIAIEAARVMKDFHFEATVKFIAFSAEEQGLIGSEAYVAQAHQNGDQIEGALNFDMIGYDENTKRVRIFKNDASTWLANFEAAIIDTYVQGLTYGIYTGTANSDHYSFWQYGYDAIMDHENIFNPYYHSTQDLFQYLDPSYFYLIAKAGIACLSALARPFNPSIPDIPTVFTPFNFEKTFTKNPIFKLTTHDPQGDDVIYRILWSIDTLFTTPESVTTPPYPSGQIITYTLPSPLMNKNTYWFKVKAKDTTTTGGWSSFTPKFSLTIDTSMLSNTCSWYQTKGAQFKYNIFDGTEIQGDSVVLKPFGTYIDTLLFENFEAGNIPNGWTVIDGNNDGYKWVVGTTSDLGSYTPPNYGTKYAFYSDDDAGSNVINYNEELWTPKFSVPSNILNLKFKYGYGFRVYQQGEKYRVHFRKKVGGSWTNWSVLKVYTTSVSGTDSFDLTNQLPFDSIQFRFFYSDSNSFSHWGYACAADNLLLIYSCESQFNEGTMTTAPCFYKDLSQTYPRTTWGYIYWEKSKPEDSVGVQVEYFNGSSWQLVPDAVLPGNSQGFFTNNKIGQVQITNLDTLTYNTLRLKVIFVRKQNAQNPALLWVEIGNPATSIQEIAKNSFKPEIYAYPNIFKDKLYIKYILPPFERAKIKIYNITGRKIKEISYNSKEKPVSGIYVFEEKNPQGIYFIKFETKNYKKTLKAIHIK